MNAKEARNITLKERDRLVAKDKESIRQFLLTVDSQIESSAAKARFSKVIHFDSSFFNYPKEVLSSVLEDLERRGFMVLFLYKKEKEKGKVFF